jgi:hypothetical protein
MSEEKTYRFPGHKGKMTRKQWLNEEQEGILSDMTPDEIAAAAARHNPELQQPQQYK